MTGWLSSRAVDESSWLEPPTVNLANLGYVVHEPNRVATESEIKTFILRYGNLGVGIHDTGGHSSETPFEFPLLVFRWLQQQLRIAWETGNVQLFTDPGNFTEGLGFDYLPVNWEANQNGIKLRPANCLTYMGMVLARDLTAGRARVCENKDSGCPAPYFVSRRADAKYCSRKCAVNKNVMKHRLRHKRRLKRKRSKP